MNWIELKALHELYSTGTVKKNNTLSNSAEIRFLVQSINVLQETRRDIYALESYKHFYEQNYLEQFAKCEEFLNEMDLVKPQMRFELDDIKILIAIHKGRQDGTLEYLREQIISSNESLRGVSLMFFKHEKYILSKPALIEALKKVLNVDSFANEKDKQYMYRLECHNPKAIVLCENLDFLTKPEKTRQHRIELWYAGGKNIRKLEFSDSRKLPIYYSCDWDYDGLLIYSWVKEIIPAIQLLYPNGNKKSIEETEHASLWVHSGDDVPLAGLPQGIFTKGQIELIKQLIFENAWIIEESNDIITMLKSETPSFQIGN